MKIAVAGGTGTLGRHVVATLTAQGHEPIVLTRSTGADLMSGNGLAAKLRGADAVVDVTSVATTRADVSERFFRAVTTNLLAAEEQAARSPSPRRLDRGCRADQQGVLRGQEGSGGVGHGRRGPMDDRAGDPIPRVRPPGDPSGKTRAASGRPHDRGADRRSLRSGCDRGTAGGRTSCRSHCGCCGPEGGADGRPDPTLPAGRRDQSTRLRNPVSGWVVASLRDGSILPKGDVILGTQTFDEWLVAVSA